MCLERSGVIQSPCQIARSRQGVGKEIESGDCLSAWMSGFELVLGVSVVIGHQT